MVKAEFTKFIAWTIGRIGESIFPSYLFDKETSVAVIH